MQKVLGIGGVFFRSKDPDALADWYSTHLGINPVPTGPESGSWQQEAGPTVFAPFKADTDYFPADKQVMINFRVADLDAMLVQLRAAGVDVPEAADSYPEGSFARLYVPEGNAIELWQEPA